MKKNLIKIFAFLFVMGVFLNSSFAADEKKVLKTDEKEAVMIDDTKMQDVSDMPSEREIKKFKKEQEKLNKEKQKKEAKELKKQQKEQEKLQKEQEKLQKEEIKKQEVKEDLQKTEVKEDLPKTEVKEEPSNLETSNQTQKEEIKEAKKEEIKEETPVSEVAGKEEKKEETTVEEVKNEEPTEIKKIENEYEAKLPLNKQEEADKKAPAQLYKKDLTYEDIEKNAVSVNEFLQFTDKQNEKFSIFYYKTTSKLSEMTKQIKNKEQEKEMVKRSRIVVKDQIAKIEKIDKELLKMYKERDEFYNKALEKFNSMLNKRQQIKWEILQQMGYRFFPEFD